MQKQRLSKHTVDSEHLHVENGAKFSKEELAGCFDLKDGSICDTKDKLGKCWPPYDQLNLCSSGCNDEPLLKATTMIPESLCFVHINIDHEPITDKESHVHVESSCLPVGYESEDEENEFML